MPKNKVYEHDYEWTGQENKAKGVNLQEKNPWSKPAWGSQSNERSCSTSSYAAQPDRFGMNELQRLHQWEKPNWATAKESSTNTNKDILKDSIPKPMLKKTVAGVASGIQGASSVVSGRNNKPADETEKEIAEMERRIEEVRQKKLALEKQKLEDEEKAEQQRNKHTIEESKLEKARRLAKEREDARWRATLGERNERDKEKREHARLTALSQSSTAPCTSDTVWQKTQDEEQMRYLDRVQQETIKRKATEGQILSTEQMHIHEMHRVADEHLGHTSQRENSPFQCTSEVQEEATDCEENDEILEEYDEEYEEFIEEYVEEDGMVSSSNNDEQAPTAETVDSLQRQIEELRRQLEPL
jgi:hypothetical protein